MYVSPALYQMLQTTNMSFEIRLVRLTSFQKLQLQSISIFSKFSPPVPHFGFAVLLIPSFNVWTSSFYVSFSLVGVFTVWILTNFVTQFLQYIWSWPRKFLTLFKSFLASESKICIRNWHLFVVRLLECAATTNFPRLPRLPRSLECNLVSSIATKRV